MAKMSSLARLGKMTPYGKAAGKRAAAASGLPVGMRDTVASRTPAIHAAYHKAGRNTALGILGGSAGLSGMMRARNSSSTRGGYSPPTLRQPRGSGRHA